MELRSLTLCSTDSEVDRVAELSNYTIDHSSVDWPDLLATWAWLVPAQFRVWIMNRYGDLFLQFEDGSVNMLDVGRGSLERLADSR